MVNMQTGYDSSSPVIEMCCLSNLKQLESFPYNLKNKCLRTKIISRKSYIKELGVLAYGFTHKQ